MEGIILFLLDLNFMGWALGPIGFTFLPLLTPLHLPDFLSPPKLQLQKEGLVQQATSSSLKAVAFLTHVCISRK